MEEQKTESIPEGAVSPGEIVEVKYPVSPEALAAAESALKEIKGKSFSGRHPELGKMIKCAVCNRRHREHERKCEQTFKELWVDEDLETGELSVVYATVPLHGQKPKNPVRAIFGAAGIKGKRKRKRPSVHQRQGIEMTRALFPAFEGITPDEEKQMHMARKLAQVVLKIFYRTKANRRTAQQELSRRINRGTVRPGTQLER